MLIHWVWYTLLPKLPASVKLSLLKQFSDPEDIYYTQNFEHIPELTGDMKDALENKDLHPAQAVMKQCADRKIRILTIRDAGYPSRLRNIVNPPLVLYYKGILPDFEALPVIGVVGTRKASAYGLNNARQMSAQIAACGGLVVSGGAAGIDTMALQGALDMGKPTVAVLGCGVDVIYPKSNRALFSKIEENGCLLSEYLPGTEPKPWQFPERNRIISGLSNGVLVVEAPEKSGALITASDAFEQGRDVFAVPGNIGVASGAGSNRLLQDYAHTALSGWDVLKDYADQYPSVEKRQAIPYRQTEPIVAPAKVAQPAPRAPFFSAADKKDIDNPVANAYSDLEKAYPDLTDREKQVMRCLDGSPQPVDTVIANAGLPAAEMLGILTRLAVKGMVLRHPGNLVSARK